MLQLAKPLLHPHDADQRHSCATLLLSVVPATVCRTVCRAVCYQYKTMHGRDYEVQSKENRWGGIKSLAIIIHVKQQRQTWTQLQTPQPRISNTKVLLLSRKYDCSKSDIHASFELCKVLRILHKTRLCWSQFLRFLSASICTWTPINAYLCRFSLELQLGWIIILIWMPYVKSDIVLILCCLSDTLRPRWTPSHR